MIKKSFPIILLCALAAASCGKSEKVQQEPFIDLELLEEEDTASGASPVDSLAAEDFETDSLAMTAALPGDGAPVDSVGMQIDFAAPAKPSVNDLYEEIRAFITKYGDEGLYVFDNEDYAMTAPGMKTQYVLAALTTQGGLQAAVAPKGKPAEMETVRLAPAEEARPALEAIASHLKYERAALQRRPF